MKYELSEKKKNVGKTQDLDPDDLRDIEIFFPPVSRVTHSIHNSFANKPTSETIANQSSVAGVREDSVVTNPAASWATERKRFGVQATTEKRP